MSGAFSWQALHLSPLHAIATIHSLTAKTHTTSITMTLLKRKADDAISLPAKAKKAKAAVPQYHLTPSVQDEVGQPIWPARKEEIKRAREIIKEW